MRYCEGCERCFDDDASSCAGGCETALRDSRVGDTDLIAGYRLEYLLDSGVRGETFRATRLDCGKSCLIKIVHADVALAEEFLREAAVVQAMFHHGIAAIYEAGRLNDREVFVVAEEPNAQTLREQIDADGALGLLTTIRIARQTAEAVHALHTLGVAHRAVNPSNIFIDADQKGELLVRIANVDFGGAVEHAIVSNKFLIDTALDSLRYFSPEQCRGEASTAKSDIYALGVVFYEMLAGSPPFDAANASGLIEQHLSMNMPEIKINNFDLRALLSHTLMESLQKTPALRQGSADLFARQLRHVEQLATHAATPPPVVAAREQPRKVAAPATVISVVPAALDLPSTAEVEAAGVSFANVQEPLPIIVPRSVREENGVIAIDDAYSETLGPRAEPYESEPELSEIEPPQPGLIAKAASFANAFLNRASTPSAESGLAKTIDFGEVRKRMPALFAKAEKFRSGPRREPTLIDWEQPLDDVPSLADAVEELHLGGAEPSFAAVKFSGSETMDVPTVRKREPETRIVEAETKKKTAPNVPVEAFAVAQVSNASTLKPVTNFVPSSLTASQPVEAARMDERSELFGAFENLSADRFPRARRYAAAGAVFAALAIAFLFRGAIADAVTPYDLAAEYPVVPLRSAPEQVSAPPAAPATVSAVPDVAVDQPQQDTEIPQYATAPVNDDADNIKPITVAAAPPPRAAKKEADREEPVAVPSSPQKTNVPVKADPPLVPSTRVITYSKGATDRDPSPAPKNAAGQTRPRIVKDPKP